MDFLEWNELPAGVRRSRRRLYEYIIATLQDKPYKLYEPPEKPPAPVDDNIDDEIEDLDDVDDEF